MLLKKKIDKKFSRIVTTLYIDELLGVQLISDSKQTKVKILYGPYLLFHKLHSSYPQKLINVDPQNLLSKLSGNQSFKIKTWGIPL